jgi:hypothetical protein
MTDEDEALARRLAELGTSMAPAPWSVMEARLRREGLIAGELRTPRPQPRRIVRHLAAAAVYLVVGLGAGITITRSRVPVAPASALPTLSTASDSASEMRLAVLQAIVLTTGAALREAPGDALINRYHLAALTQRDALLGQTQRTRKLADRWF